MSRQLVFELGHRPAFGREDFLVAPSNQAGVALIDSWPEWPDQIVILYGAAGSGKTHLAEVWREASGAVNIDAGALETHAVPSFVAQKNLILEGLALPDRAAEEALFHLVNMVREERGFLLITSSHAPAHMNIGLPDLASRLRAVPQVELGLPDDALLSGLLVKLFNDRQLRVSPSVITYLASRIERSMAAARAIVERLDQASLSGKRPITVPLIAEMLPKMGDTDAS